MANQYELLSQRQIVSHTVQVNNQFTTTVQEEDNELLDETEDEQNLKANILKNKKRRIQGPRPLMISNKVRKIDNDNREEEEDIAGQENTQDPDNLINHSESLVPSVGDQVSLMTQISQHGGMVRVQS